MRFSTSGVSFFGPETSGVSPRQGGSKVGPMVPGGSNTEKRDNAPTARVDAILGGWFQWFQLFIEKEKKFSFSRRPVGPT